MDVIWKINRRHKTAANTTKIKTAVVVAGVVVAVEVVYSLLLGLLIKFLFVFWRKIHIFFLYLPTIFSWFVRICATINKLWKVARSPILQIYYSLGLLDSCVYRCFALGLTSARGRMGAFLLSSQTTQYWCSWCLIIKASNIIINVLVWGLDRSPPRSPAFRLLPPLVSIMWWLSSVFVTGGLTYPACWSCCHAFVKCRVNTYLIV